MGYITDKDRTVFSEAHNTVLDNFTEGEQVRIGKPAGELKTILEAAKKRQREKLSKAAR
jgi:hypothetical protein